MTRKRIKSHNINSNVVKSRDNKFALPDEYTELVSKFADIELVDMFKSSANIGGDHPIIIPPYSLNTLVKLPSQNHILKQCIDVYINNIDGAGYTLEYIGEEGREQSSESQQEKDRIYDILEVPNPDENITDLRRKNRCDKETVGYDTTEVLLNKKGEIAGLNHIPSQNIRETKHDKTYTIVNKFNNKTGRVRKVQKRFKRYVQQIGSDLIYFKEFGDPRDIDKKTGKETNSKKNLATSLIVNKNYMTGFKYGVPRWINQLPAIVGSRSAELVNSDFFSENAIPAMAVLVGGGQLSSSAVENIKDRVESKRGRKSMNDIMILEAFGDENATDDQGRIPAPKIEMKPFTDNRQTDSFFDNYISNSEDKITSSFRIGRIFLGRTEDMNYASSLNAVQTAETFTFSPEKRGVDDMVNNKILLDKDGVPPKYWKYKTSAIRLPKDSNDLAGMIETLHNVGAMTPNHAIDMANDMFGKKIDRIQEDWGNLPYQDITNSGQIFNSKELEEVKKIVSGSRLADRKKEIVLRYLTSSN